MQPEHYPRRVLVCATGLSPQVVTETIYALAVARKPAFVPTEIHIISTAEGAERARLTLMADRQGYIDKLCAAWNLPRIPLERDNLHVIRDADGRPLDDIVDADGNKACADTMLQLVSEITGDQDTALHVSIAGGRKTMGYLLGYTLTLFGRPQDQLSHVLVSKPYESNPEFFFPTPKPQVLSTRDNTPIDASEAEVQLVCIPYVTLRSGSANLMADSRASFSEAIAMASLERGNAPVDLDLAGHSLTVGEWTVKLPPQAFALWLWLLRLAQADEAGVCNQDFLTDMAVRKQFRDCIQAEEQLDGMLRDKIEAMWQERDGQGEPGGRLHTDGKSWLSERVNEINRELGDHIGSSGARFLGVARQSDRGRTTYRFAGDPGRVRVAAAASK